MPAQILSHRGSSRIWPMQPRRFFALLILLFSALAWPQSYQRPPKIITDILSVPPTPAFSLSPRRDRFVLVQGVRYPPIADLAQPVLRIAGLRINPMTNGPYRPARNVGVTVRFIDGGKEIKIPVPKDAYLGSPVWSPDGLEIAFTNTTNNAIELWIADTRTGKSERVPDVKLNGVYGASFRWMPGGDDFLCKLVPKNRPKAPVASMVPVGPVIQESSGKAAPVRTYQDLLKNNDDVAAFDYYATSQLAIVKLEEPEDPDKKNDPSEKAGVHPIGKPAVFASAEPSPDRRHLLVERIVKPYSFILPVSGFAREVEVWSIGGKFEYKLASLSNEEGVPIEGVPIGPRNYEWEPTQPATLDWVEALDKGNPKNKVPFRDKVMELQAPFSAQPREIAKTQYRFAGLDWSERSGIALLSENDQDRLWTRTWLLNVDDSAWTPKLLWDRSVNDHYGDPGSPIMKRLQSGYTVIEQFQKYIYLSGTGASPKGDRPFLDRLDLTTFEKERLCQSDENSYESVVALAGEGASKFITRYETVDEPPNFFLRSASTKKQLTSFPDPAPQLKGITKKLVTYKRDDGVDLSFTLYLPPGYKDGTRLPTVLYAYPLEYTDKATAGQVTGSANRFTTIGGYSELFFLTQGYAVLYNATIPIIGDPETVNNTFIEQLVSSARAAIDKASEMGVTDRNRVGVTGHSYGAFMTANLLAHSDLFKAGIARSGAYNRTLTPFGFQSERRTIWQAPEMYLKVSPFMYADKINEPLLLIHGIADDNPGTFPIQSERLFQAVKGNGGTVRLVMLPYEAHGYSARESTEHVLWEMLNWFDKYVRNAH